jgi:putative FmdB family regulatory protein
MPVYEYGCEGGHRFEVKQKFSDTPITTCQVCALPVTKLISASGISFKGSGWYVTDYSNKLKNPEAQPKDSEKSSDKSEKSSDKSDKSSEKPPEKSQEKSDAPQTSTPATPGSSSPSKPDSSSSPKSHGGSSPSPAQSSPSGS